MPPVLSKILPTQYAWLLDPEVQKLALRELTPALLGAFAALGIIHVYKRHYGLGKSPAPSGVKKFLQQQDKSSKQNRQKASVDLAFFIRLFRTIRILVPGIFTMEALFMVLIVGTLLLRTYADVWMIETSTKIEASIIDRKKGLFWSSTIHYLMCMPLISVVNSFLRFGITELKLRIRERLTQHFYRGYLNGLNFYKMINLDSRISNPDQLLTQDIDRFCDGIVELYSNISKPLVDVALYVSRIGGALGFQAPVRLFIYLLGSGAMLTYLRRPIGRMTVIEQQLEGDYRFVNSRLIINAEEIAFYQGSEREKLSVLRAFQRLVTHLRSLNLFRFPINILDNIVAKYLATVVGWYTMSRPFFSRSNDGQALRRKTKTELMENYYTSGRMMFRLAEALGRLALAGRELTRLAGFTARIEMFDQVLADVERGKYQRTMLNNKTSNNSTDEKDEKKTICGHSSGQKPDNNPYSIGGRSTPAMTTKTIAECKLDANSSLAQTASTVLTQPQSIFEAPHNFPGAGQLIIADNVIRFNSVPLVTPNGDVLLDRIDLEVRSGMNVLICGPNGCGKSSLFRVLGELWPLWGGTLTKPAKGKLFYVPQRPYMTIGTLRDQVIYPDRPTEMRRRSYRDQDLAELLAAVQLDYILARDGGWDASQDWMDVLSGGEKQRIAMARLFYHRPQFAILDECTSAVSADVEGAIYERCTSLGITLFTVSHRRTLWRYHNYALKMDGRGNYEFVQIAEDDCHEQQQHLTEESGPNQRGQQKKQHQNKRPSDDAPTGSKPGPISVGRPPILDGVGAAKHAGTKMTATGATEDDADGITVAPNSSSSSSSSGPSSSSTSSSSSSTSSSLDRLDNNTNHCDNKH